MDTPIIKEFDMSVTKTDWTNEFKFNVKMNITLSREQLAEWAANTTSPKVWKAAQLRKLGEDGVAKLHAQCGGKLKFDLPEAGQRTRKPAEISADDAILKLIAEGHITEGILDSMLEKGKISQEAHDYYVEHIPEE